MPALPQVNPEGHDGMGEAGRGAVPFRRSLQFKVFLGVLLALAVMLAVVLVVFYFRGYELLEARERALTSSAAQRLAGEMGQQLALAEGVAASLANLGELLPHDPAQRALRGVARTKITFSSDRDGERVQGTVEKRDVKEVYIGDYDGANQRRVTVNRALNITPTWSPDARSIAYTSYRRGYPDIFISLIYQGTLQTPMDKSGTQNWLPAWSPDGKFLMYAILSPQTKLDLLYRERAGDGELGEPVLFLATPSDETGPQFSPDGRFVLYVSDESGRNEVYVRSFPGGERKWQVSTNGGEAPSWRSDGKEIYYLESGIKLMVVPVSFRSGFVPGPPVALFENPGLFRGGYDAAADGQRFVVRERLPQTEPLAIHIVHNWFEEFRNRNAR